MHSNNEHCKITKTRSVHLTGMSHTALRKNTSCQRSTHGLHCRLAGGGGVIVQAGSPAPSTANLPTPGAFLPIGLASWRQAFKNRRGRKRSFLSKEMHSVVSKHFMSLVLHSFYNKQTNKQKGGAIPLRTYRRSEEPHEGKKLEDTKFSVVR